MQMALSMENTMQVAYETVKYATGYMNNINPMWVW